MDKGLEKHLEQQGFKRVGEDLLRHLPNPGSLPLYDFSGNEVFVRDTAIQDADAVVYGRPGHRRSINGDVLVFNHHMHVFKVQGLLYETVGQLGDPAPWHGRLAVHNALHKVSQYLKGQLPEGDSVLHMEGEVALPYVEAKALFKQTS